MDKLEHELKSKALFFVKGTFPEILQESIPQGLVPGEFYVMAILKAAK